MRLSLFSFLFMVLTIKSFANEPTDGEKVFHARSGLPNFFDKVKKGLPVNMVYLGGSITEAPGYRVQTEKYFKNKYPNSAITGFNAGVGGTGSPLGVFRMKSEVLIHKPDLVFVEFAVNDAGTDSLLIGKSIEGIVRQIKRYNRGTDICFLYTIYEPMLKNLLAGIPIRSVQIMENIAEHYHIPSINLAYDVLNLFRRNELIFHGKDTLNYGSKIVFSLDGTHPSTSGHAIYTKTIISAFDIINKHSLMSGFPEPLYKGNFEQAEIFSPTDFYKTGGWSKVDISKYLKPYASVYPGMIYTADIRDSMVIKFKGTYVGIGDIIGPPVAGTVLISIDGNAATTRKRFDNYGWFYRRSYYLIGPLSDSVHTISIKMDGRRIEKLKIIDPLQTSRDTSMYRESNLYIGNVMILGEKR